MSVKLLKERFIRNLILFMKKYLPGIRNALLFVPMANPLMANFKGFTSSIKAAIAFNKVN